MLPAMYGSLRDFVRALESRGELARVRGEVSPVLEISHLADRESKKPAPNLPSQSAQRTDPRFHNLGGKALLFESVKGSDIPVLINAYGSYSRVEHALGCPQGGFDEIAGRIAQLVKPEPPRSWGEIWTKAKQFLPLLRIPPRRLRGIGECQEVVTTGDDVDLTRLPLIRCWPLDGDFEAVGYPKGINDAVPGLGHGPEWNAEFRGRYVTLAGIHTIHADDVDNPKPPSHNIGMYRVQLLGKRRMAMHWHMHHDGARHWRSWKKLGKPMPVAIVLGGESVLPYAATAPLPPGISELLLAGFLNRRGIPMVRAHSVPLWVPDNAEIVIEGYVSHEAGGIGWDPKREGVGPLGDGAVFEGPFGDHTGFYSMPDRYPVLDVTAITMRKNPIYPTTVVGLPPQEDYFLGKATERIFLPLLKTIVPDIEDYDLPMFGAFHNCAMIKVRKDYPMQGRRVMHSIWGAGQMAWTKCVFVVDHDVDVHDHEAVLRAAAEHCQPGRDIECVNGPLDILDHAAPHVGVGTKIGYDCTRKWPGEDRRAMFFAPALVRSASLPRGPKGMTPELAQSLVGHTLSLPGVLKASLPERLGYGWLLVSVEKYEPKAGDRAAYFIAQLLSQWEGPCPTRVIVLGHDVDPSNPDEAFFHWLAHTDVGRDARGVGGEPIPGSESAPAGLAVEIYDATPKVPGDEGMGLPVRDWPPLLKMDAAVVAAVESRCAELGL